MPPLPSGLRVTPATWGRALILSMKASYCGPVPWTTTSTGLLDAMPLRLLNACCVAASYSCRLSVDFGSQVASPVEECAPANGIASTTSSAVKTMTTP